MHRSLYNALWYSGKLFLEPKIFYYLVNKKKTESLPPHEIKNLQLRKLRKLLHHAYTTTVFYKEYFSIAGITPDDIRSLDDYSKLPVVTKEDIRTRIDEFVSHSYRNGSLQKIYSGGSTGVPTMVYHPKEMHAFTLADYVTFLRWMGLTRGDKTAFVWGLNRHNTNYEISKKISLQWFLRNMVLLDAFDMSPQKMDMFVEVLLQFKPALVIGYTSALTALAQHILNQNIVIKGIRAVQSTAENLNEIQRETIQKAFRCSVYNQYGSTEIMWIAAECSQHQGLHVFEDSRIVQVSNPAANERGEFSELIVTDLENYGAPLIRYKNNDLGIITQQPCACGIQYARISKLGGRVSDMFTLIDGTKIHGEFFTHVFYDYKNVITQFQLHQIRQETIIVRIVFDNSLTLPEQKHRIEQNLLSHFRELTGEKIQYRFEYLPVIPNEQSGKFRFTKSDVVS